MSSLRTQLIRLAHKHPEFRQDILPLLREAAEGKTAGAFEDAVKGRKFTSPETGNKVVFKSLPPEEQAKIRKEWTKSQKGKAKPKSKGKSVTPDKQLGNLLSGWQGEGDAIQVVMSNALSGKAVPAEAMEKAHKTVESWLAHPEAYRIDKADIKQLTKAKNLLQKHLGEGGAAAEKKAPAKPAKAPAKSWKKNYGKSMESVMGKHSLTDEDAEQVMDFKKDRPRKGKPVSPQELLRRFMQKAKPETKERMKGVSAQEFAKMIGVIFDDEDSGGKTASDDRALRSGLIRLAHAMPEHRQVLLACLTPEAPMQGKFEEGKPADPTENMTEEQKKEWWAHHERNKDQFKGAATSHSAGMAVVRKLVTLSVRVLRHKVQADGIITTYGQMSIDFGGDIQPEAVRFIAEVTLTDGLFRVRKFTPIKSVSGGGADIILGVLRDALQEAFTTRGAQLLGNLEEGVAVSLDLA